MAAEMFADLANVAVYFCGEFIGAIWDDAIAITLEHREGAIDEIPQAVGEFGMVTGLEAGIGPVAVRTDIEFARHIKAERVHAPFIDDRDRIDDVAGGLGNLFAVLLPETVGEDLFWHRSADRFEHDRPINGVELENVFADHMQIGGPEFRAI